MIVRTITALVNLPNIFASVMHVGSADEKSNQEYARNGFWYCTKNFLAIWSEFSYHITKATLAISADIIDIIYFCSYSAGSIYTRLRLTVYQDIRRKFNAVYYF